MLVALLVSFGLVVVVIGVLSILAPIEVRYTESIDVDAPVHDVFDDIRLQERLMRWSVWPRETGSQCAVDPGPAGADGTEGSRTVFVSNGRAVGYQRITRLVDGREIAMTLEGPGPPHEPALTFELETLEPSRTRVHLHFVNRFVRPFNAIWHFAGLSTWTRELHRKDLAGLKAFSEPPHVDADGREVGRASDLANPYAVALPESA